MVWVKLDDGFPEHLKVQGLSDRAFRLHIMALCFCARNLTDGRLSGKDVRVLGAILDASVTRAVDDLVAVELWHRTATGYEINDYLEFNPSAEKVRGDRRELSKKRREAGTKGAQSRWGTDGKEDGKPSETDGKEDGKAEIVSIAPSRTGSSKTSSKPDAHAPESKPRVRITDHDTPTPIEFAVAAAQAQAARAAREAS